jgi:glycosyltransferase involved in cell wall biosynthesis
MMAVEENSGKQWRTEMAISVAMAVYNGEAYLSEQLDSILGQLKKEDEIIISMDPSDDHTESMIKQFCKKDSRVKLCRGPGEGVVRNFENALRHCRNDIIFLSDQDDVWKQGKVTKVLQRFKNPEVMVVLHDAEIVNEHLEMTMKSFFEMKNCRPGIARNIIKNSYIGCCMAFRRECLKKILPFPKRLPMHDQWIGIVCESVGKASFIEEPLLLYRRHEGNLSEMHHGSWKQMLQWRVNLIGAFVLRILCGK